MNEKRQLKRRQLNLYPEVLVRNSDYIIGKLADITQEGFMVLCSKTVELEKELPLQIKLPETLFNSDSIGLDAICMRCKKDAKTGRIEAGFRITDISDSNRVLVNKLILEYRLP